MKTLVAGKPLAVVTAAAACVLVAAPAPASAGESAKRCAAGEIKTASGCASFGAARREVEAIVARAVAENDLRAAIARVDVGDRRLATTAEGESMAGVPATPRMHFRIGSMAIPYLINLMLQLQDDGVLSLDDRLSKWLPDVVNADRVTLRMMAQNLSGYPDWIQGNDAFVEELYSDVFRQWRPSELMGVAFGLPPACEPGDCFRYAHTNYALISKVLREATGKSVAGLIRKRVFRPLRLRQTDISALPAIPEPVLHAYTSDRGPYEDSTSWSPSWTIGRDTIMTGTVGDIVRSARAIGTGRLISAKASREQFAPDTARYPGFSEDLYFGLGIVVANTWRLQNPQLNGYTGIMAYLPAKKIALGLVVTNGQSAAASGVNYSQRLFVELAGYLAPKHPVTLPGG